MMVTQVIVLALVMSFIIKRDSEVVDYEDAFGKMNTVDDINMKGLIMFTRHFTVNQSIRTRRQVHEQRSA